MCLSSSHAALALCPVCRQGQERRASTRQGCHPGKDSACNSCLTVNYNQVSSRTITSTIHNNEQIHIHHFIYSAKQPWKVRAIFIPFCTRELLEYFKHTVFILPRAQYATRRVWLVYYLPWPSATGKSEVGKNQPGSDPPPKPIRNS